jgi:hypothetical protein
MNNQNLLKKEAQKMSRIDELETADAQTSEDVSTDETKIHEKEVIVPQNTDTPKQEQKQELSENKVYLETKEQDRQDVVNLIQSAEEELADLKLRKYLMESDFPALLESYQQYLLHQEPISTIGRSSLIEYFTYELLKPLNRIGLSLSDTTYDTWKTRYFDVTYLLDDQNDLFFSFIVPTIDQRYQTTPMPLIKVSPQEMKVEVQDDQVLALIRYWSVDKLFSASQLTIFNHELNQLLQHARQLGFSMDETLLDNTKPIDLRLESEFELDESILDEIFIVTMNERAYDMEKLGENRFEILLDKGQSLTVSENGQDQTVLEISSGEYNRSVIDFFVNYEFLVPLMVREE